MSVWLVLKLEVALSLRLKSSMNGRWLRLPATKAHLPSKWWGSSWSRGRSNCSQVSGAARLPHVKQKRRRRRIISVFTGIVNLPPLVHSLVFVVKSHFSTFYPKRILIFHNSEKTGEHSSYFTCGSRDCEINDCCEVSDLGSFTQKDRMLASSRLCGWRVQMQWQHRFWCCSFSCLQSWNDLVFSQR